MFTIIGKDLELYSLPLGATHKNGYNSLVTRTCEVTNGKQSWSGLNTIGDRVMTTNFFDHEEKDFDVKFKGGESVHAFKINDWGDIIEIGCAKTPIKETLTARHAPVSKGETLFVIGNFLGMSNSFASFEVNAVMPNQPDISEERFGKIDPHSSGSPIYGSKGELVGILVAYIPETNWVIGISLYADDKGLIKV